MKNNIVITSNANPDLDGYASAIGYADLLQKQGKNTESILLGRPQTEIIFVANYLKEKILPVFEGDLNQFDQIIMVDTSFLGTLEKEVDPKKLTEIIDHRAVNQSHLYPWAKVQIELIGSCATLIVEKYRKAEISPNKTVATYLYGAIASNTINFKNKITTQRDIRAAEYLKKIAHIPDNFVEKMFLEKSDFSGDKLEQHIKHDYVENHIVDKYLTIFQIEIAHTDLLVRDRLDEICKIMNDVVADKKLDFYFINIIDVLEGYNYIISPDEKTKKLLEKILELKFQDSLAKTDYIIMRKEIVAKIKDHFTLANQV